MRAKRAISRLAKNARHSHGARPGPSLAKRGRLGMTRQTAPLFNEQIWWDPAASTRPASQKTNRSTQSPDRSSEYETSHWARANYHPGGRSPSSRLEFSARPENRSRSELIRRSE